MFEILEVTAQYSNAVLVAILPYVSDFAKKLELPVPQPITASQVLEFKCSPRADLFGGRVVLTNGHEFAFLHGHVEMYRSPRCYYELQDPDLVPRFFGPVKLKEKDAVRVAREAIKKLGYAEAGLYADRPPRITPPARVEKNYVSRYRVLWNDPSRGDPGNPPMSAQFEIDAANGQIHMMYLLHPSTWREPPKVTVVPRVIATGPQVAHSGTGSRIAGVNPAYAQAFLKAILPQLSEYVKKAGFPVKAPLSPNDPEITRNQCGIIEGDPRLMLDLKSGARFVYGHGQVTAFYAPDVTHLPGEDWKQPVQKYFGPINLTSNQAIALVRQTIKRLGYSESVLHVDEAPFVGGPPRHGTNTIARYFLDWKESRNGAFRVCAEVDASTSTLKSLYINDHANTNIWRPPPKLRVRPEPSPAEFPSGEPPPVGENTPPPSKL